jgi:thioredoxin reductase (NADPH)
MSPLADATDWDTSFPSHRTGTRRFLAEFEQLSGQPALLDGVAKTQVEALLITTGGLRALLIDEAELGERIMRALILRRVALIETGVGGPVLIGPATSPGVDACRDSSPARAIRTHLLDPSEDAEAKALLQRAPQETDLPVWRVSFPYVRASIAMIFVPQLNSR